MKELKIMNNIEKINFDDLVKWVKKTYNLKFQIDYEYSWLVYKTGNKNDKKQLSIHLFEKTEYIKEQFVSVGYENREGGISGGSSCCHSFKEIEETIDTKLTEIFKLKDYKKIKKDEENIMPKNEEVKKQDYTNLNVAQKLALARTMWLEHKVEPTGLNTYQEFKYFTLMDIEPVKVKIFNELNLIDVYDFGSQVNQAGEPLALLQLYNGDNRQEACLKFALPYKDADEIVSSQGKRVTNRLQQLGSANSYIKRFLLMNCLSITQQIDEVDETIGMEVKNEPKPKVVKKPLNEEEKKEVVNKVVGDEADEMQLQALKKVAKKLNDIGEQELAKKLQLKSNNFTSMSRENCEKCIEVANGIIDKSNEGEPWE